MTGFTLSVFTSFVVVYFSTSMPSAAILFLSRVSDFLNPMVARSAPSEVSSVMTSWVLIHSLMESFSASLAS